MTDTKDKMKFNPMSKDPVTSAYTQSRCFDAMHLVHLFVNTYNRHRYEKQSKLKHFEFVNAMDVFHKECKLYGFVDNENPPEND